MLEVFRSQVLLLDKPNDTSTDNQLPFVALLCPPICSPGFHLLERHCWADSSAGKSTKTDITVTSLRFLSIGHLLQVVEGFG